MRTLFLFFLLSFFTFLPQRSFALTACEETYRRCECTSESGEKIPMGTLDNSGACAAACGEYNSYAFFCGDERTPVEAENISDWLRTGLSTVGVDAVTEQEPAIPSLNVPIPGLDLEGSVSLDNSGYVTSNMIGLYVNAVFAYAIVLGAILGVLMLTLAGFQYMTAGGDKGAVTKAKNRMQNTVFGLILLMATYSIAFLIDPRTTRFNSLVLENISAVEYFPPEGEDDNMVDFAQRSSLTGIGAELRGKYIIASNSFQLDPETLTALQAAAQEFHDKYNSNIVVSSAKRDLREQARLFYNNCIASGGVCNPPTCNPSNSVVLKNARGRFELAGRLVGEKNSSVIIDAIVADASFANCPHTSAIAVDLWCDDGGSKYQHNPVCQERLIQTMISKGFCRLTSEAWHFELNSKKVSRNCSTGNNSAAYTIRSRTYTPSPNCRKWDFRYHKCVAT